MPRSAYDTVYAYVHEMWDKGQPEMIRDLCADPMIRHYSGKRSELTLEQQIARVAELIDAGFSFEDLVLYANDEFVTQVWNVVGKEGTHKSSGIEVYRVKDGRIAEVWNAPYGDEHFG